ncbi:MAG: OmpA/MotB domain protein [Thermodesulfobacterium sp. 37_54]|jgi:peptidoglycan-associated lipoprotein|uniref:Peptidoglycan-associated lipoprotein n=2 Tax=Thermodesulfobacterium TaxID=1740 RepID=A0A101FJ95_9BACT|nr:peptidoglycan-associated lipoprotein Pal [Thermodesulfobacterium sp.]KUJ97347.1 MAG: OmpA/MotB domain protein [Thermodesulfobacterium sp. 37_54]KUK19386.1 MAG: OmpA/MotB domain protein [Thermodesulfobacterium commune]KUK38038.1 MAG: OmpA/MotB domain protein [Thermodesulfobacterium commune]MDN5380159.1 peptidoglycan-associated lipoprotein [Thermodesulfobacterium sp.]HAA83476.1 peptidoglycan-associated lipoprotein Pal [Thermodesulfobacterium commune]
MVRWWRLLIGVILLFSGCAKKEVPPIVGESQVPVYQSQKESTTSVSQPKAPSEVEQNQVFSPEEFKDSEKEDWERWKVYGRSTPPLKAVFFDYDDYSIKEDMWEPIKHNVKYLLEHKDLKVELQGNCDERGTNEYNMALGAKRAQEVKKVLTKLGIDEERINTISFGEERPLAKCSNETCWAINRRVDFVIINNK